MTESLGTVSNDSQDPQHHAHGKYMKYIKTWEVSQLLLVYLDMAGTTHLSEQITYCRCRGKITYYQFLRKYFCS